MAADKRALAPERSEQRAAIGGLLFVTCALIWARIVDAAPDAGTPSARISEYFFNAADRHQLVLGGWVLAFGAIAFLWFLGSLRSWLRRAEGEAGAMSALAFGAGLVMVTTSFAKNAIFVATAGVYQTADHFRLSPDLYKVLFSVSSWLLAQEVMAGGVLVFAASAVSVRTGVLPRWFAWPGFAVAVVCLLALPLERLAAIPLLAWIMIVSLLMWSPPASR